MSNFINLCLNEISKIYKKTFTWFFLILLIFSLFVAAVANYLIESKNITNEELKVNNYTLKEELKHINISLNFEDANTYEYEFSKIKKECYDYVINNNIPLESGGENDYYKYNIVNEIIMFKTSLINNTNDKQKEEVNENIEKLFEMLNEDSFDEYIKYEIDKINKDYEYGFITKEQRQAYLDVKDLEKKYEIGKYNNDMYRWKVRCIEKIESAKLNLLNKDITSEKIKELNDIIALENYKLEHNEGSNVRLDNIANYNESYMYIVEMISIPMIAIFFIINTVIILGKELSDGTIKHILMTPNKRWKILLSKILVIVLNLAIITIIFSILAQIVGNIIYKDYDLNNYLYISNGNVNVLNSFSYTVLRFLTRDIEILVYILFAFMVSLISNEAGVPLALSVFLYFGNSLFMNSINKFINMEWVKYIPFNNFDITSGLFKDSENMVSTMFLDRTNTFVNSIDLTSCVSITVICMILFIVISFTIFKKKNI